MSTLYGKTVASDGHLCYTVHILERISAFADKGIHMNALERFLSYAVVHTASDRHNHEVTPSTPCQHILAKQIEEEMKAIGLQNVVRTEHAYVYGFLPATPGYEDRKCIGFNAHLDIVADLGIGEVKPQVIENYDGHGITLGDSGRVLLPEHFPHLNKCIGKTIVTTDGTTVLGADDKAGIAAIMTMAETVVKENLPHGRIAICFSPDEEIGHGAELLDLELFGADYGFTVDGSGPEDIEAETFNAACATIHFNGVSVHPGNAKDTMVNAALLAMEFDDMLPVRQRPCDTEGHQGFWHLCNMQGDVTQADMYYIIRDHDAGKFAWRQKVMQEIANYLNLKYGEGTVELKIEQEYRNMFEVVSAYPELLVVAERAIRSVGLEPAYVPVRGGTDGAQLSFRGLPCPNLGAGGYGFHGPYEHLVVEELEQSVAILLDIVRQFAEGDMAVEEV